MHGRPMISPRRCGLCICSFLVQPRLPCAPPHRLVDAASCWRRSSVRGGSTRSGLDDCAPHSIRRTGAAMHFFTRPGRRTLIFVEVAPPAKSRMRSRRLAANAIDRSRQGDDRVFYSIRMPTGLAGFPSAFFDQAVWRNLPRIRAVDVRDVVRTEFAAGSSASAQASNRRRWRPSILPRCPCLTTAAGHDRTPSS